MILVNLLPEKAAKRRAIWSSTLMALCFSGLLWLAADAVFGGKTPAVSSRPHAHLTVRPTPLLVSQARPEGRTPQMIY